MSRNRESRILGAGEKINVNGKEYMLRPVVVKHLCDLEREALRHYKRQFLQTFSDNADLLSNDKAEALIEKKMEEVASWDLQDLPQKNAYDCSRVPITKSAKRWIEEHCGETPDTDAGIRAVLNNALDVGRITKDEIKKLTGAAPLEGRVRYDQWWVTASVDGMISFIISSLQVDHPEVTKDDVRKWSFNSVAEASRKVESITSAAMGNT